VIGQGDLARPVNDVFSAIINRRCPNVVRYYIWRFLLPKVSAELRGSALFDYADPGEGAKGTFVATEQQGGSPFPPAIPAGKGPLPFRSTDRSPRSRGYRG
jgi:hypothetical protein